MRNCHSLRSGVTTTVFCTMVMLGLLAHPLPAADVVFQDNFERPGEVPPQESIPIAETNPQIGKPYSGQGTIWNAALTSGSAQAAGEALGGKNFAEAGKGTFQATIGSTTFEGTFPDSTRSFDNLIFYNPGGSAFYFANPTITAVQP